MPLFECSQCHAIDNTAITNFWWNVMHENQPALCSACDPEIGFWHDKFPKLTMAEFKAKYPNGKVEYPIKKGEG